MQARALHQTLFCLTQNIPYTRKVRLKTTTIAYTHLIHQLGTPLGHNFAEYAAPLPKLLASCSGVEKMDCLRVCLAGPTPVAIGPRPALQRACCFSNPSCSSCGLSSVISFKCTHQSRLLGNSMLLLYLFVH